MKNRLVQSGKPKKFSVTLQDNAIKNLINNTLGNPKRAQSFIASISSAVATNPALQDCDHNSIINAALLGETLELSPSPQLGHYFLVPYNDKIRGKIAQFQMGYKGYLQLAMRSGQYRKINVLAIKEGELVNFDPLNEEITVNLIEDDTARENAKTIGYYAMFEYLNGFRKAMYWSKEKMEAHALKYSKGYQAKKGYSFWEKDFDGMAYKTMLRQLISKWGIMSIELQTAIEKDMAAIGESGEVEYVDNDLDTVNIQIENAIEAEPIPDEKIVEAYAKQTAKEEEEKPTEEPQYETYQPDLFNY